MGSDDNLQFVTQRDTLKFQHRLLLRVGVETCLYFINQNERVPQI